MTPTAPTETRKRFLLVARHVGKVNALLYEPIRQKLQTIGDILGPMALPEAIAGGAMHTLPRIQRRTWERLALIRAGKDWKDLERRWTEDRWAIEPRNGHEQLVEYGDAGAPLGRPEINRRWYNGVMGVNTFGAPSTTVTGRTGVTNGAFAVADPRPPSAADRKRRRFNNVARVAGFDDHSPAVTGGAGPSSGGLCVADPRPHGALGRYGSKLRVEAFDGNAHTVIGAADIQSGALSVADPRLRMGKHSGKLRVEDFHGHAHTVTGSDRVGSGAPSVADPRLGCRPNGATLRVVPFDRHSPTVIGTSTTWSSGSVQVADPRLGCSPRNGTMGVRAFDESFTTVTGNIDVHAGTAAVADPRQAEVPIILSDDGCWHRPLTTLELAALQGFPVEVDGAPLVLAGRSASRWRMGIGNAVPPPTARAIAEQMLRTLLVADAGAFVLSDAGGIWVREADGVLRWQETSRAPLVRCVAEAHAL